MYVPIAISTFLRYYECYVLYTKNTLFGRISVTVFKTKTIESTTKNSFRLQILSRRVCNSLSKYFSILRVYGVLQLHRLTNMRKSIYVKTDILMGSAVDGFAFYYIKMTRRRNLFHRNVNNYFIEYHS